MKCNRISRPLAAACAVWVGGVITAPAFAALMISDLNSSYTIDFDDTVTEVNNGPYTGSGFSPTPAAGQLDSSAWATTGMNGGATLFDGGPYTVDSHAWGASEGDITFGGFWGFDVDNSAGVNRALGIQPTGADWTPGTVTLRLQNLTGFEITEFAVSYLVYVRNDKARANSFNFSHSADDSSYTPVGSLDFTSPGTADASPAVWAATPRSTTLTELSIPNNSYFYLRWSGDDVSGSLQQDEFALDDIVIRDIVATAPEPATVVLAALAGATLFFSRSHNRDRRPRRCGCSSRNLAE